MSYPMIWAESAPVKNAIQRCILTLLAETTTPEGGLAVHSLDALADYAVCDIETVRENLVNMFVCRLIDIIRIHKDQVGNTETEHVLCDLLIPRDWYSDAQWADVQEQMRRYKENPEMYRYKHAGTPK